MPLQLPTWLALGSACLALGLGLGLGVPAVAEEQLLTGTLDLTGLWQISFDEGTAGDDQHPASPYLDVSTWRSVVLPASWADLDLVGYDRVLWLRKSALLPSDWSADLAPSGLAISLGPTHGGSFSIWAGGERVAESPGGRLPIPEPRVFPIPSSSVGVGGRLHMAIRFQRHAWQADREEAAMPFSGIQLGDRDTLHRQRELYELRQRTEGFLPEILALLLLIGSAYHLLLWSRRRALVDQLWFALTSLDVAALTYVAAPPIRYTESLVSAQRLMFALEHLAIVLFIQFLWTFLGTKRHRWLQAYQVAQCLLAGLVLVLPWPWVVWIGTPRQLLVLPFLVAVSHLVSTAAWSGSRSARILMPGTAAILVTATAEMLLQIFDLGTTFPLPSWAFALFALSLLVALSSRYTGECKELESLRLQLERMVDDRTTELRHSNERLQAEISERQLAEEAMRMLERAVEQSIDGIAVADLDGNMQFLNEAWANMHGYEVFELLGYDLNIFHTPEQVKEQLLPLIERVRETGSHEAEIEHRRRGGETFPTWMTATFLQDSEGGPSGTVFIARDLTERRKTERERRRLEGRVKQAEKLESLGSLAGGIAHDYNNILTGVLGNTSLALQELPADSAARERLQQIEMSAERAAELTDQLLAYAGEEQHVPRAFSLNELILEQKLRFEECMMSNARLELHLKRDLPQIDADPAQITQAILNLLSNAADSLGQDDGVVMLRTSAINAKRSYFDGAVLDEGQAEGRYVFFEVSDSGCGMDQGTQSKMFDPFFSTKASGRGLGLAAVLGIVRAHGGAIKVYSQPQRGTTIEVLFPIHGVMQTLREESGIFRAWRGSGTALVVDDEELVREVAVKVLEHQGFEVLKASDGPEALEIYESQRDDIRLVLLDLTMPQMDGETVFREIRRRNTDVKVLLMSGYREKNATQGLEGEGLAGFLHKPFRPNELLRKVREVLLEPS
ncbi:MAG: response regulator [Thermoanaerobaculia bacterium]|nr:response regulator [Thermoanaerobaculia bacterium]